MDKPKNVFYCSTNSGHEHSTEWEATNCTRLYELLKDAYRYAEDNAYCDEWLAEDIAAVESR